jgi:hypothetical protein
MKSLIEPFDLMNKVCLVYSISYEDDIYLNTFVSNLLIKKD